MAFTRAQATDLLNQAEMRLYDDSRANGLRGLDRTALAGRVERARTARDRARDLLKRQRLAARKRGEGRDEGIAARTARKEALLVEILQRFVDARRTTPVGAGSTSGKPAAKKASARKVAAGAPATGTTAAKKASTRQSAATRTVATRTAARKAVTKKAAAKKATGKKSAAKTAPAKKAATTKTVAGGTATKRTNGASVARKAADGTQARKAARSTESAPSKSGKRTSSPEGARGRKSASRRTLSPERALENTRRLLEAKQERDRTPQPWQSLDPAADHSPQPGFQSPQAAEKAQQLHAGESRMASIHGSMATHDRRNQGKRDHRGGDDDSGAGP